MNIQKVQQVISKPKLPSPQVKWQTLKGFSRSASLLELFVYIAIKINVIIDPWDAYI